MMTRWKTVKGLAKLALFMVASVAVEYLTVAYAVNLGVEDPNPLRLSFQFPGTSWKVTVAISLLFHIVPLTAVIALTFSWVCLTGYLALSASKPPKQKFRRVEKERRKLTLGISQAAKNFLHRVKAAFMKSKGFAMVWSSASRAKTVVKSSLIVLFAFLSLFSLLSLAVYPKLFLKLYWDSPSTLELVMGMNNAARSFVETLAPIRWICTAINNAIIASAPNLRTVAANLGSLIKPLADLTLAEKYLFLQNFAVWASSLAVLLYGLYVRKSYRYRKLRKD